LRGLDLYPLQPSSVVDHEVVLRAITEGDHHLKPTLQQRGENDPFRTSPDFARSGSARHGRSGVDAKQ